MHCQSFYRKKMKKKKGLLQKTFNAMCYGSDLCGSLALPFLLTLGRLGFVPAAPFLLAKFGFDAGGKATIAVAKKLHQPIKMDIW
jgi:hypothetical protein